MFEDDDDSESCIHHDWSCVDSDGRQVCDNCGEVMPRHMDPDDCLDCGVCDNCIERSQAYAEGMGGEG